MKHRIGRSVLLTLAAMAPAIGFATNGDNMIAIGPKARAMGGVSIAYPQDAITAVFGNPAALCFTKFCPSTQVDFAGTLFMPDVDAAVTNPLNPTEMLTADSDDGIYPIPAIGVAVPFGEDNRGRFGLAAYGVSGLGVDYRDTVLGGTLGSLGQVPPGFDTAPIIAGSYTSLQIMKFAPSVAWQVAPGFSLGAAAHIDYAILDMGQGSSSGYGFGLQVGATYRPTEDWALGFSYTTPQEVDHDNVINMGMGPQDLTLEMPQQLGAGIAYEIDEGKLVLAADLKWINWSSAKGYEDFDWRDQTVVALGIQYEAIEDKLVLRAGYNYGKNPVKEHNGWDGSFDFNTGMPNDVTVVQGIVMPTYFYETFRIIGFPAVVESHVTVGMTYHMSERFALSFAYMRALEKGISESGTGPTGAPTVLLSNLSEDSLEFGLSWKF
ncbi:MAG: OmpP1/FadL family transporter [Puniceicoccaceae bacterium]